MVHAKHRVVKGRPGSLDLNFRYLPGSKCDQLENKGAKTPHVARKYRLCFLRLQYTDMQVSGLILMSIERFPHFLRYCSRFTPPVRQFQFYRNALICHFCFLQILVLFTQQKCLYTEFKLII